MLKLKDKTALVTGASKGIGAGIAKELAASGAAVVVNYATDRKGAEAVVRAITAAGGRAVAIQGDVSKAGDVARLFDQMKAAFGTLDVLVNNAGVYQPMPLVELAVDEFHREINTNLFGPLLTIRESLKHFGPDAPWRKVTHLPAFIFRSFSVTLKADSPKLSYSLTTAS